MAENILVFGDSITYGAWDKEGGWVTRLRRFLQEQSLNTDEEQGRLVYNLGVSGDSTQDLLLRFESEVKTRLDEGIETIIIFAIGLNDSLFIKTENKHKVSLSKFEENLLKLITLAKKYTSKIVFIRLTSVDEEKTDPIPWDPVKSYKNEYIQQYNSLLEKICNQEKVDFIKIEKFSNDLFEDGLHPNSKGHKIIFEAVKNYLLKK
ncbi:MAG: GDSL-type esterase/lipase family protein [Candidatus Levyibacteriota bacterium]